MELNKTIALVTGANRGIGRTYAEHLARAGAPRVYAAARDLASLASLQERFPAVVPLYLDVTDRDSIARAAARAGDVNLLINNAGILRVGGIAGRSSLDEAHEEMEVNYFGLLEVTRAFAPLLTANVPSAIINVLSILGLMGTPGAATYSASKAAALSATRAIRAELAPKQVRVVAVMPGYVDTEMTSFLQVDKISPDDVVAATFAALASGDEEVYPGGLATELARAFFTDHKALERQLAS
ncbi:MAG TPA: SDR family NAD(P)-dependent oxidoreductase [Candidatus Binatia bacterium]|nr:SDR family NAD(P)-dependent oxidoreductase [Candidatus Binatia bacterium]